MKNLKLISAIATMILLVGVSFASAALCKNDRGYYEDCDSSYTKTSGTYSIRDRASTPIFKGSYGNYRYQMYENGDYSLDPNPWFTPRYGTYGRGPVFNGGYGYGGYRHYTYSRPWYGGWFSWFWW